MRTNWREFFGTISWARLEVERQLGNLRQISEGTETLKDWTSKDVMIAQYSL